MKKFIPVLLIFILGGCGKEKTVQIKGTLRGADSGMIYLKELGIEEKSAKSDSVQFDSNGNFLFKRKISQPTFYSLTTGNRSVTLLAHPREKITIGGDARHLPATYSIEGSDDSEHISRLNRRMEYTLFIADSLEKTLQKYVGNRNFVNIQRQLEWNYINEVDSLRAYNIRFIDNHPQSLVVIYALYQKLPGDIYLFNEEEDIKYFQKADSFFYKRYPTVPYVKLLHSNVVTMAEQYRRVQLNRLLSMLGQQAPEIALPDPQGQVRKLSSQKGKYVLLDFWASWSAQCRAENLHLVEVYNKYRTKGFEIFQVSLDQSKSAWQRAIREDGLTWNNVSDLKFWDSEIVKEYGVETIPANFLLDREGTIISKGLKSADLDKKLSELFVESE